LGSLAGAAAEDEAEPEGKKQQQMWGLMGFGGLFVDNFQRPKEKVEQPKHKPHDPHSKGKVEWGAPLRGDWCYPVASGTAAAGGDDKGGKDHKKAKAGAAAAAGVRAKPRDLAAEAAEKAAQARAALPPPASALALTVWLIAGSQAAGILDVTQAGVRLLLQHKARLTPPQLARLAARMAEAGMFQEIEGLVDSSVGSGSHQGQAVGFVAAALTGNLERLQTALELSGTDPLAALQANTYRLPSALATERHWNEALQRSSCQMAKHPTSSYAYFNVTRAGV